MSKNIYEMNATELRTELWELARCFQANTSMPELEWDTDGIAASVALRLHKLTVLPHCDGHGYYGPDDECPLCNGWCDSCECTLSNCERCSDCGYHDCECERCSECGSCDCEGCGDDNDIVPERCHHCAQPSEDCTCVMAS